jgi:predicted transcriptional regulator of viral defense system
MPGRSMPSLFRPRELESRGVSRHRLRGMIRRSEIERIARGLYRVSDASATEHETLATVAARVPDGVVCLLTALQFHGIGTHSSRQVWIAIDRKARLPRLGQLPVRIVRFSGPMLKYGVETRSVQGVTLRVTSPARTVVDCFRYRRKIGLDVALEALQDVIRSKATTPAAIMKTADMCRVSSVMRPYVEAIVA